MRVTKAEKYGIFGWKCELDGVPHKTNPEGDGLWQQTEKGNWRPMVLPIVSFAAPDKKRFSKWVRDFFDHKTKAEAASLKRALGEGEDE